MRTLEPRPLADWEDLPLDPADREAAKQLLLAVLCKNPDAIGKMIGRPLESRDAPRVLHSDGDFPRLSFIGGFVGAIKDTLTRGRKVSLFDAYLRGMSRAVLDMPGGAYRAFALAQVVPGLRVGYFHGGEDVPSQKFPEKAVKTVERWMDAAYLDGDETYPHYNGILKRNLPRELVSPDVTWSTMWMDDELVAVAKSRQEEHRIFFGTHYGERGFPGFGSIVRSAALNSVRHDTPVYGHVAPHNPTLFRHFRVDRLPYNNATLGIGLVRERDEEDESEELLETAIAAKLCGFQSVHTEWKTDKEVDAFARGAPLPTDERRAGRLRVYPAEALKGPALLEVLRNNFADDYILTRRTPEAWLFEDRYLGNPFLGGRIYWDFQQRMLELTRYGEGIDTKRSKA